MRSDYEEKRQARIDRLNAAATKASHTGNALLNSGHQMFSAIPFGQPILVGHHSESRDRNYRNRAGAKIDKGLAELKKASHYAGKADADENNKAISSDNPEAVSLLLEKIAKAEREQADMVAANKIIKSKKLSAEQKTEQVAALLKVTQETALKFVATPDFCGRTGFPAYMLQNNNANIRRMKERVESLKAVEQEQDKEWKFDDFRIVDSVEDNRLQIFFSGKPEYEMRCKLKSGGFRWAPSAGAWQRFRGTNSIWAAEHALGIELR